ncbi:MAG: radical SAM protein [Nanoarchaeota archaeon]|nr:radical SAM protein [Nanoarchaeota archaeon]
MKILLVNPPYRRLRGVGAVYFPLGLGYLASILDKAGNDVKIYNGEVPRDKQEYEINKYKGGDFSHIMSTHQNYLRNLKDEEFFVWQQFKKSLEEFEPDLVGVSVRTPMLDSALEINHLVKKWNKNCLVIWGGSHPTILPEESIILPGVDFLVYGEGERTMLELVEAIEKKNEFSKIKGLYYKTIDGKFIKTPQRQYINNLDELPFPARHLVFEEDIYLPSGFSDLMGSRGCPFLCSYCSAHSLWGRNVRYRSVANIIEEIKILKDKYHCEELRFLDDNLTLNRLWIEELCNLLIKEKINLKWSCLTRVNLIDENLLKLMIKAGCYGIDIGVESGSPRILEMMKKGITLNDVLRGDRLFNKYGISWTAFFITGFPYETREDLLATANFMKKINPYRIVLSNFTPYPMTEDYNAAEKLGVLPEHIDWGRLDHNSPDNFFMKNIKQEEYKKFFQELNDYVSLRNTNKIKGKEIYYLKHPLSFFRKTYKFIKKRIGI